MDDTRQGRRREVVLVSVFLCLTLALYFVPTGYKERQDTNAVRCRGLVLESDNALVQRFGLINTGSQDLTVRIESGRFRGDVMPTLI